MSLGALDRPLVVVVGGGGVGKTTLAAALGVVSAEAGTDTLVMTFDPSRRLKDALGVGDDTGDREVPAPLDAPGRLDVSLLDARATFDRLVARYAPTPEAAERVYRNRFYRDLSGSLAGILEYMAVERLFEVASGGAYRRVILDTPPTRQALDFLEAPDRVVGFLDSGAVKLALAPWFDRAGRFRRPPGFALARKGAEAVLDRIIGAGLLRDMAEFFEAFAPLYGGFRERAEAVRALLRRRDTVFLLVGGPGEARVPDTMHFARRLRDGGHHLGAVAVNLVHPMVPPVPPDTPPAVRDGLALLAALGDRDRRGLAALRGLLGPARPPVALPLRPDPPGDLPALADLGRELLRRLAAA
ncbi:MAG TPA: ArsA-related P-loop ATPase [Gemmatimonadales bacterium]|nr:ArsA-related P-loop ATPase [Gemmatimonadales bacterium]